MKIITSTKKLNSLILFCLVFVVFAGVNRAEGKLRNKNAETAVEILKSGLSDSQPAIRSIAIEAVAASKYTELMPKVQGLMTDNFVVVRFSAIVAVGDVGYVPGAKLAKKLLTVKEENTKLAAAYALVKLGNSEYLDNIRKAIESEDQTVKANAAFLLGKADDKESLKLLYSVLEDRAASDKAQLAATVAIATLKDEKIFPKLWAKALSKYSDDRIVGIEAMGFLGTNQAKDVLITKLDDEDVWVRMAAAEQLAKLGNNTGQSEVLEVLSGKFNADMDVASLERLNMQTCNVIGQMCSKEVMEYLPGFLASESKNVRVAAAKATLQCWNKTKSK